MTDERHFQVLRLLADHPDMSQRELASELGVSLGAVNHCVKALIEKGWVKLESFQRNPRKVRYLYVLTPTGITAKARLTVNFLKRKLEEYAALEREIAELEAEVEQ